VIAAKGGKVTRFDVVARGSFWGEGPYSPGAPPGKFPFAVAFTLTAIKSDRDRIPPAGARGWLRGYLEFR
jgi:hypothetical protein